MKNMDNTWKPMVMYCNNCAQKLIGFANGTGTVKYECPRCQCKLISKPKGRRHTQIDIFAPQGQVAL